MPDTPLPITPSAASASPDTAAIGQQAIKEAVDQLRAALPKLQEANAGFTESLRNLLQRADDPVRLNQVEFQHRIAYAVQDAKLHVGPLAFSSPDLKSYVDGMSVSAPGLGSERIEALLVNVRDTPDGKLRNDVRRSAIEIGKQADQDTPQIRSQIETLENRLRLAERAPAEPAVENSASNRVPPVSAGLDAAGRVSNSSTSAPVESGAERAKETVADPAFKRVQGTRQPEVDGGAGAGMLVAGALLRGFEKLGQSIPPAPWENMTTNFGDRLKMFETRRQGQADERAIEGLEQSGRSAINALQSFANNEGAVMMNRINQAARSDPNGMDGVMAEMRPGGKFASLRQQFNTAINDEKGFAAAYDKAIEAVSQYGMERAASKPIVARSPDSLAVATKLEAIEQNIGERMAGIPSKTDGKAMMDDLRQQAAEIFKAVAEGLKDLFQRATAGASPSPG